VDTYLIPECVGDELEKLELELELLELLDGG